MDKLQEMKNNLSDFLHFNPNRSEVPVDVEEYLWLIEHLEQAQATIQKLDELLYGVSGRKVDDFNRQLKETQTANQKLVEGLQWYAAADHYQPNVVDQWQPITSVLEDKGQRARTLLAELKR